MSRVSMFFYDSVDMQLNETICELDKMLRYCFNYKPNYLEGVYINNYGKIDLSKVSKFTVHSDDRNKSINIIGGKSYKCVGVKAQYIVVDIDGIKLRVLPDIFILDKKCKNV